ncbi:hypothetical protein DFJ73DRAFT_348677 [Zopfochytrium polystomum]|nr:hypothetical protein DFJ73DRAFT_348677 [Zopfochytrium polystomum]
MERAFIVFARFWVAFAVKPAAVIAKGSKVVVFTAISPALFCPFVANGAVLVTELGGCKLGACANCCPTPKLLRLLSPFAVKGCPPSGGTFPKANPYGCTASGPTGGTLVLIVLLKKGFPVAGLATGILATVWTGATCGMDGFGVAIGASPARPRSRSMSPDVVLGVAFEEMFSRKSKSSRLPFVLLGILACTAAGSAGISGTVRGPRLKGFIS